jgi:phage terminase small subunit
MSRRGPKGKPPALKVVAGTDQPSRRREQIVDAIEGEPVKPTWLKGRAAKLWHEKVAIYAARGQAVVGCESALAQYCAMEATLIDQYAKKITPAVAQVTAFRALASEFFDTPASQIGTTNKPKGGKFAGNGQRPPPPPEGGGNA